MKKYGLMGLIVLTLALLTMPAMAVPLEDVSLKVYDTAGNPLSCPQKNTTVVMNLKFTINTTTELPMTYQIRLSPLVVGTSYFDFSKVSESDIELWRGATQVTDFDILGPGEGGCGNYDLCILAKEGNNNMPGYQKFNITVKDVVTPAEEGNYSIAIGFWNQHGTVQYGEYTVLVEVCPEPVIIIPPEPEVIPCPCMGNAYKYDKNNDTWYKATPDACFKERAPYKEGLEFIGWMKYINGEFEGTINYEHVEYSDVCAQQGPVSSPTTKYDDFSYGDGGWLSDGQWVYGQPLDLEPFCGWDPDEIFDKAWGLGEVNYTETPSNLTKTFNFNCDYNGTVTVYFTYAGYLEDGDYVVVEGWNGTGWDEITKLDITNNTCTPHQLVESFSMNTSGSWDYTQIRFRFVSDGDENVSAGIYIYDVGISAETVCTGCVEYVPEYYESACECLSDYIDIPLNGTVNVTVEAVYRDPQTGGYQKTYASLNIVFDNLNPQISWSESDDSIIFTVVDTLSGVEANADDEPIIVDDQSWETRHWEQKAGGIWSEYYYYVFDLIAPSKAVNSAAIFFEKIGLGYEDELYVYGGCDDCEVFYAYRYWGYYYWDWGDYEYYCPWCEFGGKLWVRVPMESCEICAEECDVCCEEEFCGLTCEDCGSVVFYDYNNDTQYGVRIGTIVYGTGIKVFLGGEDITSSVTITPIDEKNVTITVPKSLFTSEEKELKVVVTDKVGNANMLSIKVKAEGEGGGAVGEPWEVYDANDDGAISDDELLNAIMGWLDNKIGDEELLNVIMKWLS